MPNTWILLPVLAITNTSLTAGYDCHPTYTAAPCAGHGDCYLLLDSADHRSQPYIQASTQPPLPVNASTLDSDGIDTDSSLPAAVCLCHDGYTGRADYVSHDADDGDCCAVYQPTINALAATGCALFSFLSFLALVRLYGWYAWHRSSVLAAAALGARPPTPKPGVKVEVISPSVSARQVSPPQPAAADAPLISSAAVPTQSAETVAPLSRGSAIRAAPLPSSEKVELVRRKQNRLLRHLQHESFLHPAASLSLSLLSLAYFILRLTTDLTIGDSYRMSAIVYWQHVPYIVASCLGVAGTLQLAASIAKLKLYNGWDGIAVTKKCLIGLCLYQSIAWIALFFLVHHFEERQQVGVQLFVLLCVCPDFLLGPITVLAVRRISYALLTNLDSLSAEQQQQRRAVHTKLRRMATIVAVLTLANSITCLWLTADSRSRQSGLPYYTLVWHYSLFVLIAIRLLLVQPPRPIAAVCPLPRPGGGATLGGNAPSHNSSGATPASSRPVSHVRHKSMGALRASAGGTSVPYGGFARGPRLVGAGVAGGGGGGCESVTEVQHGEEPHKQDSHSTESTSSEG